MDALPAFEDLRSAGAVERLALFVKSEPVCLTAPDASDESFEPCVAGEVG